MLLIRRLNKKIVFLDSQLTIPSIHSLTSEISKVVTMKVPEATQSEYEEQSLTVKCISILLIIFYTNQFVAAHRNPWGLKCRMKRRLASELTSSLSIAANRQRKSDTRTLCYKLTRVTKASNLPKNISRIFSKLIFNWRGNFVPDGEIIQLVISESIRLSNICSQARYKSFIKHTLSKLFKKNRKHNAIRLKPVRVVPRSAEIQSARMRLPIFSEEYQILEKIEENDVTIISGATGSGKTTQVPQFLYEAGYADPLSDKQWKRGMIGVTEPRRLAAVSMATRVAEEMGFLRNNNTIGFQTRFNTDFSLNTRIKFMTDGVLMRELESDFLLSKYSVICLDEAHERSVYTDILIGIISRVIRLRVEKGCPFKLVIMSATLRLDDFLENRRLFPVERIPPVIHIEARQYPVTIHFSRVTNKDYLAEALKRATLIHRTLPAGTILVFLTSKKEIYSLCDDLQSALNQSNLPTDLLSNDLDCSNTTGNMNRKRETCLSTQVIPLHAQLSTNEQSRVFKPIPLGIRRIVVSTNVAETSLTIPDVKYVIDTGRVKRRLIDRVTGVSTFKIDWCSQASAEQRAGRAGRTAAGHVYRLYSSSVFLNEFPKHTEPEILQCPLDDLYLQMKCMNIQNVSNFPFPTQPDRELLQSADNTLCKLGALSSKRASEGAYYSLPTGLGRKMNKLPVAPRLARVLIEYSHSVELIHYLICIVSGLSILDQLFSSSSRIFSSCSLLRENCMGDLMLVLRIVCASEFEEELNTFSSVCGVNDNKIVEIQKLRKLLTSSLNTLFPHLSLSHSDRVYPPDRATQRRLCKAMLLGFGDHVASMSTHNSETNNTGDVYECALTSKPIYIFPFSSLSGQSNVQWLAFIDIVESNRMYMRCLFPIEWTWIPQVCESYCEFSQPLQLPSPFYDPTSGVIKQFTKYTYMNLSWRLPPHTSLASPNDPLTYRLFAKALLEGQVFDSLLKYNQKLLYPTLYLTKPWGKHLKEAGKIVSALRDKNITSKTATENEWKMNSTFLLEEYCHWLPASLHSQMSAFWPPHCNSP